MILTKGTKVLVHAPDGYPDIAPQPGTITDTPKTVFQQMAGMYQVADADGQVWEIHRDHMTYDTPAFRRKRPAGESHV